MVVKRLLSGTIIQYKINLIFDLTEIIPYANRSIFI